jgi:hypothetical protein
VSRSLMRWVYLFGTQPTQGMDPIEDPRPVATAETRDVLGHAAGTEPPALARPGIPPTRRDTARHHLGREAEGQLRHGHAEVGENRGLVGDQGGPESGGHRGGGAEPEPIADRLELDAARPEDGEERLDGHC